MGSQLKFLIVEDDLNIALDLEMMLEEMGYKVQARADNSAKALEIIFAKKPDIILMDIDIKGDMTGTDIGKNIKHLNIPIIFITGFNDKAHFKAAQESNMNGYIIKPPNQLTLQSTIENVIRNMNRGAVSETKEDKIFEDTIFLKKKSTFHKIDFDNVQCIEADGKYSLLYVNDDKFISKYSLTEIVKMLPENKFMRIHRSFILNLDYLVEFDPSMSTVRIQQGKELPISRTYREEFMAKINIG